MTRAVALATVAALLLAGCSAGESPSGGPGATTPAPSITAERIADSFTALCQKALDTLNPSPVERQVIERALTTGRLDPADYEAAHIRYVQCMAERGFNPPFRKTPAGLYIELPYEPGDMTKRDEADSECSADTVIVSSLFRVQQANPDLLSDPRLVAVRCLRREGLITLDYSVDDLDRDKAANAFPFDQYEETANNCLYEAGYAYFKIG